MPDFLTVTDTGENVIVEIKGQVDDSAEVKAKAAQRWVEAVNNLGDHGKWHYLFVTDPGRTGEALNAHTAAEWDEAPFGLR